MPYFCQPIAGRDTGANGSGGRRCCGAMPALGNGWLTGSLPLCSRFRTRANAGCNSSRPAFRCTSTRPVRPKKMPQAVGHSRGRRTSKLHLNSDGAGNVLGWRLTPGQAGDSPRSGRSAYPVAGAGPGSGGRHRLRQRRAVEADCCSRRRRCLPTQPAAAVHSAIRTLRLCQTPNATISNSRSIS